MPFFCAALLGDKCRAGLFRAMAMATGGSSDLTAQGAQWLQGAKEAVMQMTKGEKKDEDESYSPFQSLQKAAVLQECRCFNDREINPRKCISILTKILWLLAQGARSANRARPTPSERAPGARCRPPAPRLSAAQARS